MNKARRAELEQVHSMLEELRDQEQSAFDNMPESIQAGERGEAMESAVEAMDAKRSKPFKPPSTRGPREREDAEVLGA